MSLQTNFHAPRAPLSGIIQIGHKSGYYYYYLFSVNIKPPRHRFGRSLCMGFAISTLYLLYILYSNVPVSILNQVLRKNECI